MVGTQFQNIADFILSDTLSMPDDALFHTSTLLIDTLGVAAGASTLKVGQIARGFANDFHGTSNSENAATMLFDGRRVSLPGAAWALATQIDNLDGHDGYNPTKGHIGCAVVPSLFAFAERRPDLTGRQALKALAMSYEISARAGISLHATVSDYHTSGAWNALGVAALGCHLERTDSETLRQALGIAEYHGPRSQMMREIDNPTMLHDGSGMGALVGCSASLMAMRGFTGAPAITIESREVASYWSDLGADWTVARNYIKPYPSCRWGHAAIDALHKLLQTNDVSVDKVERIEVHTFAEAARLFPGVPETTSQAQYSLHFALAVMLRYGQIAPRHISGDGLLDPEVAALIPKINVIETANHSDDFPQYRRSDVDIFLKDGSRLSSGTVDARGGPEAWMLDDEVKQKFFNFCSDVLPNDRIQSIWDWRGKLLDPKTKFSDLAELVQRGTHSP